ncbi:MAG: histidinol-phosphate transaminase [Pseudomonadota bacterium]
MQGLGVLGGIALAPNLVSIANAKVVDSALEFRQNQSLLRLHYNENSLGMSQEAIDAAKHALATYGNIYQVEAVAELKSLLAAKNRLESSQVLLGNGSTVILGLVVTYANSMGATLLEPTPTFGDVSTRAKARGMKVVQVPLESDFVTKVKQLKDAASSIKGPVLINLCNPNNPTGTIIEKTALSDWILNAPENHIFLVDEAYHEYATTNSNYESMLSLIQQGKENVIVARTFSKVYGMAGMRVGYGFAAPKTAEKLSSYSASFNLTAAGLAAAKVSLKDDVFLEKSIASNLKAKKLLTDTLDDLALPYIPSSTNFVLHKINADLETYSNRMLLNNIKVGRRMTKDDGWNRLSLGQVDEMQAFVKTLKAFRNKGWV